MKKLTLNKKVMTSKRDILLHMLLENNGDFYICEEALTVLYEVFGDVDLSIIETSNSSVNILATTLNNEDNINALTNVVKYYLSKGGSTLAETVQIKARPDVYETKILALSTGEDIQTYLIIDIYDEGYVIQKDSVKEILDVLSLIVKVNVLERDRKQAYKVDNLTRIYTRDSLIKDISTYIEADVIDNTDVCLAALYISNASEINKTKGYEYMDKLLTKIAQILISNEKRGYVYRIGGVKFAIFSKKSVQDMYAEVNNIFEEIKELDPNLYCTASIIPVLDDAYKTIYGAECNLKEVDEFKIAIYRGDPNNYIMDESANFDNVVNGDSNIQYVDDIIDRKLKEMPEDVDVVDKYTDLDEETANQDSNEQDEEEPIILSFDDEDDEEVEIDGDFSFDDEPEEKPKKGVFGKNGQMSIFA